MEPTKNSDTTPTPQDSDNLFKATQYFKKFLSDVVHLEDGVDKRAVIDNIKNKKRMSGANAWMLMCSIMIASIGLDLNSPAVIIGAMLISPLMSPILGIGLSVGINDKDTLKKSLSHFGTAILIALVTSSFYFLCSPISQLTDQIIARTEPTVLDILIAFFGGIAGIVSIARKDISTTLPGVAIATALMPPLCVTGYGLASGNFHAALSSFYLFFLNSFFVTLSTYLIIRFLDFPFKDFINKKEQRRNKLYVAIFSIFIIIPSIWIFHKVINRISDEKKIEAFINTVIEEKNRELVDDYALTSNKDSNLLILRVYGNAINYDKIDFYEKGLNDLDLRNTKIKIIPTSEITMTQFANLGKKVNGMEKLASRLALLTKEKKQLEQAHSQLSSQIKDVKIDTNIYKKICSEVKIFNNEVAKISYAKAQSTDFNNYDDNKAIIIVEWSKQPRNFNDKKQQLEKYLKARLENDSLEVVQLVQ